MVYSIGDMAQLTGISAHSIRIWERRYGALQPERSVGHTRSYNDAQLLRLLQIAGLYQAGHKISAVCALSREDILNLLQEEVSTAKTGEKTAYTYITQLVSGTMTYNEVKVNELLAAAFEEFGVAEAYKMIVYPLLTRIGLLWLGESMCLSQEHFLSSIIRQKLFAAIDTCPVPETSGKHWLLFLPADEDHDIGLLLASYLLRQKGHRVTYLGAKVPAEALANTVKAAMPDNLLFFMTRIKPEGDAQSYLEHLGAAYPAQHIYVAGRPRLLERLTFPAGCHPLRDLSDFERLTGYETNF